ncbi:hypothetical protein [Micromonospora humida]|uniref:hypothetical protein n=1 Tax=Micromonospora humida TaxID=2809018 RepID=UPI0034149FE1
MASSSNREDDELETPVDDTPRVADGPGAVSAVASPWLVAGLVVSNLLLAAAAAAAAAAGILGNLALASGMVACLFMTFFALLKGVGGLDAGILPGAGGMVLLRGAAGLLPGWAACRYREEWAGELYDLRAEGAPWWTRVGYLLGVLLCALRLAVGLRLGGERSRA